MNPSWMPAALQLGAPYLHAYQELVIARILEQPGLRQAVVLPTGAGKSLCFQLPALLLPHPTLVVFPLRSLMADQARRCRQIGIPLAVLQGGQTRTDRSGEIKRIQCGEVRLVLTNPETLLQPSVQASLKPVQFSHGVIDEAHCYTLWGEAFRPLYRQLPSALEALSVDRLTAFTATASPRVLEDWSSLFRGKLFDLIRGGADRPNLDFSRVPYLSLRRELPRLARNEQRPLLMFCRSRDQVRHWAHHLHRETGSDVRFYHAGLTREEKQSVERWFWASRDGILVATNAYGMGVDKPDIRTVVHWELPPSTEDYLQEAGRAGRDGLPARAILLRRSQNQREGSSVCWRRQLLAVVECTPDACSGCDVCRGQQDNLPADLTAVCRALAPAVRRLDRRECRAFLRGHESELGSTWKRAPGWALWRTLDDLTVSELWEGLERGSWLEWSGRGSGSLLRRVRLV